MIFNMARGQQDYFQSTRGGGHGDYRHIVLAPDGHRRGRRAHAARVPPRRQVAQPGARLRRLPARPHQEAVDVDADRRSPPLPAKDWAVDGSPIGHRASRASSRRSASTRPGSPSAGIEKHLRSTSSPKQDRIMAEEVRVETRLPRRRRDRDRRVRPAGQVREVRRRRSCAPRARRSATSARSRCGRSRTTRSPTPPTARARVGVVRALRRPDDRRRAPRRPRAARRSTFIGGISTDGSGFGVGPPPRRRADPRADPRVAPRRAACLRSPTTRGSSDARRDTESGSR